MSLLFLGLNPRYQWFNWLPKSVNVMYSAAGFWRNAEKAWRINNGWLPMIGLKWLDCGGFTLLNKYGDYPFSVGNYMNLVARLKPHWYATMDFPCEPDISRSLGLKTNEERIQATVENAKQILDDQAMLPGPIPVPVIQGYTLDEYLYCLDLHKEAGTIRPYMAVGSMCRRISTKELNHLIPAIYDRAGEYGAQRLHYFGLKLSPDLIPLEQFIFSRDSAVIYDTYDSELRDKRDGRRWPRGQEEKREAVESFLKAASEMGLSYRGALMTTDSEKAYAIKLANYETEVFPHIAEWRGYKTVSAWLSACLETSLNYEFDSFFDANPDWNMVAVHKEVE